MEFNYIIEDSIWVSEDDLNEMAEQVKNGRPVESNYLSKKQMMVIMKQEKITL